MIPGNSRYVSFDGKTISIEAKSVDEAKLALKQMRIIKAELGIRKRAVAAEQKTIRADYTNYVRSRGSLLRGGGGIGGIIRLLKIKSRDNKRAELAVRLAPLEESKQSLERQILLVEAAILRVQAEIITRET